MGGALHADASFCLFVVYLFCHCFIICHPQEEDLNTEVCKETWLSASNCHIFCAAAPFSEDNTATAASSQMMSCPDSCGWSVGNADPSHLSHLLSISSLGWEFEAVPRWSVANCPLPHSLFCLSGLNRHIHDKLDVTRLCPEGSIHYGQESEALCYLT